jgi:hypothetical protein
MKHVWVMSRVSPLANIAKAVTNRIGDRFSMDVRNMAYMSIKTLCQVTQILYWYRNGIKMEAFLGADLLNSNLEFRFST